MPEQAKRLTEDGSDTAQIVTDAYKVEIVRTATYTDAGADWAEFTVQAATVDFEKINENRENPTVIFPISEILRSGFR